MRCTTIKYLFVISLYSFLFAQDPGRIPLENQIIRFPEALTISNLGSAGVSFLANDQIADVTAGNPAALYNFQKLAAGISWQFESVISRTGFFGVDLKRYNPWLPQSAGIVYPACENLNIAIGYNRRYSTRVEFEPIELTTPEMPMGTGEFFSPEIETGVQSYSVITGYTIYNLLSSQRMTLAFRYNLDYMSTDERFGSLQVESSGYDNSWAAGIIADFTINDLTLSFGAAFEKEIFIEEKTNYNSIPVVEIPDTSFLVQVELPSSIARMPSRLNFGASLYFKSGFLIQTSLSQVYWSELSAGFKDVTEFAASLSRPFFPFLITSIGVYSTGLNYVESAYVDEPDALFITAGIKLLLGEFLIDLTLADNHISYSDQSQRTIFKFAAGVSL